MLTTGGVGRIRPPLSAMVDGFSEGTQSVSDGSYKKMYW